MSETRDRHLVVGSRIAKVVTCLELVLERRQYYLPEGEAAWCPRWTGFGTCSGGQARCWCHSACAAGSEPSRNRTGKTRGSCA